MAYCYPGWYDSNIISFNKTIMDNFGSIQSECYSVLNEGRFVQHEQSLKHIPVSKKLLADDWSIFILRDTHHWTSQGKLYTPFTSTLLKNIKEIDDQHRGRVYFSLIPPHGKVTPHTSKLDPGVRLRHQLCIETSSADNDMLFLEVNGIKQTWETGRVLSFDDAYMHSVSNLTNHRRIVLIYDSLMV